ncbi:TetR/AcrR family transcriptional regulator [Paeniglutamicibacter sp. NPDC012692]|uniref:TetR/AcrR family transcriptional regulator n=1 Tax=Paeniglutamicibacter sp. NPDC012692 TaxID=3364388 RepID=UPI00369DB137
MAGKLAKPKTARTALDREVIVEAALRLATRPHALSLTYRELGRELSVDPTAIYRHFQSKEVLMQELLDRAFGMIRARTTAPATSWEACLMELAESTLDVFIEHPAIGITATSLTTGGPGEMACIELMLSCFSEAGLRGQGLAEQYAIFGSYSLAGAAGLAMDHAEAAGSSTAEWFVGPLMSDPASHPLTSSLRNDIMALNHREMFLAGIKQLVTAAKDRAQGQTVP